MWAPFVLILVIILAICFTTDPTPTAVEDMAEMTKERYLYYTFLFMMNMVITAAPVIMPAKIAVIPIC